MYTVWWDWKRQKIARGKFRQLAGVNESPGQNKENSSPQEEFLLNSI